MAAYSSNNTNDKYCMVNHCRFPWSHTTEGHKCICGEYGHGQIECGNHHEIDKLKGFNQELPLDKQCTFQTCRHRYSHSTIAHHCHRCFKNHSSSDCIIQSLDTHIERFGDSGSPNLKTFDYHHFLSYHDNVYIKEYAGMGCGLVIRKSGYNIDSIFLDSYGYDEEIYNNFINNMADITDIYHNSITPPPPPPPPSPPVLLQDYIKCPLCRTDINKNTIKTIKGSSDICKICLDKEVEVYFDECEHACVCTSCFNKL